jgi:hypothetical protein
VALAKSALCSPIIFPSCFAGPFATCEFFANCFSSQIRLGWDGKLGTRIPLVRIYRCLVGPCRHHLGFDEQAWCGCAGVRLCVGAVFGPQAHSRLATARFGNKDFVGARRAYEEALKIEPDNETYKTGRKSAEEATTAAVDAAKAAAPELVKKFLADGGCAGVS